MFNTILSTPVTNGFLCLLVALCCGFIESLIYHKLGKMTQSYLTSLVILPPLVAIVMMLVNGNLGTSVAIMGAFGLVRFRSAPGTSKEILGVFFAMTIGLATGIGYIYFALVFTIVLALLLLLLDMLNYGYQENREKELRITIPEDLNYHDVFTDLFSEYAKKIRLIKTKTTNLGSLFELTYHFEMKDILKEKDFIDQLRIRNGNLNITICEISPVYEEL